MSVTGKTILVLTPVNPEHRKLFEDKAPGCHLEFVDRKNLTSDKVQKANIIIGNPPIDMVMGSANLEWLQLDSAGVGGYVDEGVLDERVILTNASGAYGLAISEHMLGVLLELYKNLHLYRENQAQGRWNYEGSVKSIYNATALVVGLGDIGGSFAEKLKALGAYTIGIRRSDPNKPDYLDELHYMEDLKGLLPRADIVALSLPSTPQTYQIINKETLALMKEDAVLINVGRGNAIDTEALCDTLEAGHLLGAALDVTDPEPLPSDHRIWRIKNAIITPHVSGGFSLEETRNRLIRISADNLEAFLKGDKMRNLVSFSEGY